MSETSTQLPAGFEALEPFVARWAVAGANNRAQMRVTSTPAEREAFYAAARDRVAPALDLLDAKPLDQFDPAEQRLMTLLLAFAHVAMAVEVQAEDEQKHGRMSRHMIITRAPADA